MNPNQINYFNSRVLQHDFREEGLRSRQGERATESPAKAAATEARGEGRDHSLFGFLHLALPGRR